MSLTAQDVRNKQFGTVRFKEGYRLDEVDAFLSEIEVELGRLHAEIEGLRAQVAAAARMSAQLPPPVLMPPPAPPAPLAPLAQLALPAPAAPPMPPPGSSLALPPPSAPAVVATMPEYPADPSADMTRMLQIAERTAEARVAEAELEAQSILDRAQAEAAQATIDATAQRGALERRIDELRTFEREYRSRLRAYISGQLAELDAGAEPPAPAPVPQPIPGLPPRPAGGPLTAPMAPLGIGSPDGPPRQPE